MEHERLVFELYEHASSDDMGDMFKGWSKVFPSAGLHAFVLDPTGGVVDSRSVPFHDGQGAAPREYEEEWRDADPRMALALSHPGEVLSDVQHIEPVGFERSDVYNAVLRPFDLRYSLFGTVPLSNGYLLAHALMRRKAAGAYDNADVAQLAGLGPYLRRAFDLRLQLGALRGRIADLTSALDIMPSPLFVLDAQGRIIHLNVRAESILATHDSVAVRNQRLVVYEARAAGQLRAAVAQAVAYADQPSCSHRTRVPPPILVVEIPRIGRAALSLVVHPTRPRLVLRSSCDARSRALVVVHDPDARIRVDRALLERLHGLTPTEASLAASLAEGASLAAFAAMRGCTEATARSHLKRVLEKTGTCRQAELVHRILASTALHSILA